LIERKEELEETVRQLELENPAQLQDALEDVSGEDTYYPLFGSQSKCVNKWSNGTVGTK
jgi:hypothetical protein